MKTKLIYAIMAVMAMTVLSSCEDEDLRRFTMKRSHSTHLSSFLRAIKTPSSLPTTCPRPSPIG